MTMNDSNPKTPLRQCSNGDNCVHPDGCWQPNDAEHFYQTIKSGNRCIACRRVYRNQQRAKHREQYNADFREWYEENREYNLQRAHAYHVANRERISQREKARRLDPEVREKQLAASREWYAANREYATGYARRYNQEHKTEVRERKRHWNDANKDKINAQRREKRLRNPEHYKHQKRVWSALNREHIRRIARVYRKHYYAENAETFRASRQQRKARKQSLPDTFTLDQWIRALGYFEYRCAICDTELDLTPRKRGAAMDHWIALADSTCPGTVALNIVPLCTGCNSSKKDTPPLEWLIWRYGESEAQMRIQPIHAYFAWIKEQGE